MADCVVCGKDAKSLKYVKRFPCCYNCFSHGKIYTWVVEMCLNVLDIKDEKPNIEIDKPNDHVAKALLLQCEKYFPKNK